MVQANRLTRGGPGWLRSFNYFQSHLLQICPGYKWPKLTETCFMAVVKNMMSSIGIIGPPRSTHGHPSETIQDMCRLPRNLIWNNGGHKFWVYLISEALSFPRGPIGWAWGRGEGRGRGTPRIPESSSLSVSGPLLRRDSRGRAWVDVGELLYFPSTRPSQCRIINRLSM